MRIPGIDEVRSGSKAGVPAAEFTLLRGAPPVLLSVEAEAVIELVVDASALGAGYVDHVVGKVTPLIDELDYAWTELPDVGATQRELYVTLATQLANDRPLQFGLAAHKRFIVAAPVLTGLGPRDALWRTAVLADPAAAADAFAWPEVGPGRESLARALLAMSFEVPWREPIDDAERELMAGVDVQLRAARKANPDLPLPYAEWKELLGHLGIEDEEVNEHVGDRAAAIGYRRHDLDVELSGGWHVVIPGSFSGHWEEDGGRYWASDGDRLIDFTSFTTDAGHDAKALLGLAPSQHPVVAHFEEGRRLGRAEAYEHEGTPAVVGLMCQTPHVGILTCKGGSREWALATWRSLRQDAVPSR